MIKGGSELLFLADISIDLGFHIHELLVRIYIEIEGG